MMNEEFKNLRKSALIRVSKKETPTNFFIHHSSFFI